MKKLIRKWLGVNIISKDDIKEQAEQVIFSDQYIDAISERIANKLYWREEQHLNSQARQQVQLEIKNTIGSEKFIDDIVARIKNKQL